MSRSLALALEFRGTGDAADFGFLERDESPVDLIRVDPLAHHVERALSLDEQAELILGQMPAGPALVLGYCGTAAVALHVATLADAESVLVDPYPITADDMYRDVAHLAASLQIDTAVFGEPAATPDLTRWEAALLSSRAAMAARHGGDPQAFELVDDLLSRYRSWLRFLYASTAARPVHPARPVTVVTTKPPVALGPLLDAAVRPTSCQLPDTGDALDSADVRRLIRAMVRQHTEGDRQP
ncbi:hypothetical protein ACIG87_25635 [Micromonospora sp. NPDC051925]|uniref:hypothetical protein n=1 Tax=Micromonospora sp. NPDC051925 TaxID=3364288 RepID=UPI0037CBA416